MALQQHKQTVSFSLGTLTDLSKEDRALVMEALAARKKAYAPYSDFLVGAALRTKKGSLFSGCNIESSDYTLSAHAEMCAIDKAVSSGEKQFETIAIVSEGKIPSPCGLCRQKMLEFSPSIRIICCNLKKEIMVTDLASLLPFPFSASFLPHTRD